MTIYKIEHTNVSTEDPSFLSQIKSAHSKKIRPKCMCRSFGVEMYITHYNSNYIVKRMPNSGHKHDPDCQSFEAPAELSGRGEVEGRAIIEDQNSGITNIKIDVSLSKQGSKKPPEPSGEPADSVKSQTSKLSLSALMEYLWDEAGLSKWSPAMTGKRNWFIVQRELLQAAQAKEVKGKSLADLLLIPEKYSIENKLEITKRRQAKLAQISGQHAGKNFMLLVGEVKELTEARYGFKLVIKHLPDFHFMVSPDLLKSINKRFTNELQAFQMLQDTKLMVIATFSLSSGGYATIEELTLKTANAQWLFFESSYEHEFLSILIDEHRRFQKCLRFNQHPQLPLATVLLTDTKPDPVAMYVIPPGTRNAFLSRTNTLIESSSYPSWVWQIDINERPPLPAQLNYQAVFSHATLLEEEAD